MFGLFDQLFNAFDKYRIVCVGHIKRAVKCRDLLALKRVLKLNHHFSPADLILDDPARSKNPRLSNIKNRPTRF
jgi:hypothetical protein